MQQRQYKRFSSQALGAGLLLAALMVFTFFIVRYFVNQSRTEQLKSEARLELLKLSQLLENDITTQTIISYGLEAFLAADEDDDLNDPELTSEIENISRSLAARSSLVQQIYVVTGDPKQKRWDSSYTVNLMPERVGNLKDVTQLFALAQNLKDELQTDLITLDGERYLVSAKAVMREGERWGYIFALKEVKDLFKDFLKGLEQNNFEVDLEFSTQQLQSNAADLIAVEVNTFGKPWLLIARPNSGWVSPLFGLPIFSVMALLAAGLLGSLVYVLLFERSKANWLSLFDSLTGVGNRRFLQIEFQKMTARGELGLLLFDIDNFKHINETYGFSVGDQVLIEVADRIHNALGQDQKMARLGSDVFVVLSVQAPKQSLDELAGRIQRLMSEPLLLNNNIVSLITNIGLSRYPEHETDLSALIEHADHHSQR